jgi:hypothetical protein
MLRDGVEDKDKEDKDEDGAADGERYKAGEGEGEGEGDGEGEAEGEGEGDGKGAEDELDADSNIFCLSLKDVGAGELFGGEGGAVRRASRSPMATLTLEAMLEATEAATADPNC